MEALIGCGCLMDRVSYLNRAPYYENITSWEPLLQMGPCWKEDPKSSHYACSISLCYFLR